MYETWPQLNLPEQLGNAGSDYERALKWKMKRNKALFTSALARTLEQIDLTLRDPRWRGPRRQEIARLREEVCNEMLYRNNPDSAKRLVKYFLSLATQARRARALKM